MSEQDKAEQLRSFLGVGNEVIGAAEFRELAEALYTLSELGMWPDSVDSVSAEQAILCWRVVEKLRLGPFPKNLRM